MKIILANTTRTIENLNSSLPLKYVLGSAVRPTQSRFPVRKEILDLGKNKPKWYVIFGQDRPTSSEEYDLFIMDEAGTQKTIINNIRSFRGSQGTQLGYSLRNSNGMMNFMAYSNFWDSLGGQYYDIFNGETRLLTRLEEGIGFSIERETQ